MTILAGDIYVCWWKHTCCLVSYLHVSVFYYCCLNLAAKHVFCRYDIFFYTSCQNSINYIKYYIPILYPVLTTPKWSQIRVNEFYTPFLLMSHLHKWVTQCKLAQEKIWGYISIQKNMHLLMSHLPCFPPVLYLQTPPPSATKTRRVGFPGLRLDGLSALESGPCCGWLLWTLWTVAKSCASNLGWLKPYGWWFRTWLLFSIIYWEKSSQLICF